MRALHVLVAGALAIQAVGCGADEEPSGQSVSTTDGDADVGTGTDLVSSPDTGSDIGPPPPEDATADAPDGPPEPACKPQCTDRECGDDGCGGNCGRCENTRGCVDAACVTVTCEDVLGGCAPPELLPLPPEAICGIVVAYAECLELLVQGYVADGCKSECSYLPIPGLDAACASDACIELLGLVRELVPGDPCEECMGGG